MALEPFDKWGMDFIRTIDPQSGKKRSIIACIEYLKMWAKKMVVKAATEHKVDDFFRENILYKFWYPREIVTN